MLIILTLSFLTTKKVMENSISGSSTEQKNVDSNKVWSALISAQKENIYRYASAAYIKGYEKLELQDDVVPDLERLKEITLEETGWTLDFGAGYVPQNDFLKMLTEKRFPLTVNLREMEELEFSVLPDMFHDLIGHIPMLYNPQYADYVRSYGELALIHQKDEEMIKKLNNLLWYTFESGLIKEDGELKVYGGAIISSKQEMENVYNIVTNKFDFDIERCIEDAYNDRQIQDYYFVINSYDDLYDAMKKVVNYKNVLK